MIRVLPVASTLLALFMCNALAAETKDPVTGKYSVVDDEGRVHITWQSVRSYTDVRPTNESRSRFRKRVFAKLGEKFEQLAQTLPEGHQLKLTVTNLDLAGDVFPNNVIGLGAGSMDLRLIERVHIPRMAFDYQLMDAEQQIIKSDSVKIKDMNFLEGIVVRATERPFAYEKRMIEEWYEDTIAVEYAPAVAKQ